MQILKVTTGTELISEYSNFFSKVLRTPSHSIPQLPYLQLSRVIYMEQPTGGASGERLRDHAARHLRQISSLGSKSPLVPAEGRNPIKSQPSASNCSSAHILALAKKGCLAKVLNNSLGTWLRS